MSSNGVTTTNPEARLAYEARVRVRQVVVAAAAGVVLIVSAILEVGGAPKVSELTLDLLKVHDRFPLDVFAAVLSGVSSLLIAWTLVYLFECARARNPDIKPWAKIVTITGAVLAAVAGTAYSIVVANIAEEFSTTGRQTYAEASHLTSGVVLPTLQILVDLSLLLVALSFVMVGLQAMNQGLMSRFMGYLGMFAGALMVFQITPVPIVQCYWLLAIALLISGRWPSGTPAAWTSGRSEPWPSSAELRAQRAAGRGRMRGARPVPAGPAPEQAPAPVNGRTRATTSKRKRKRRN